jgi:cyclopropane fatty-acyl-phospholipid synthase-like methyltransferase
MGRLQDPLPGRGRSGPRMGRARRLRRPPRAAVTATLLELSTPRPGERVLELACGAGGAGIAAAKLVGPGGEVALSNVAAEMTAIAAARRP